MLDFTVEQKDFLPAGRCEHSIHNLAIDFRRNSCHGDAVGFEFFDALGHIASEIGDVRPGKICRLVQAKDQQPIAEDGPGIWLLSIIEPFVSQLLSVGDGGLDILTRHGEFAKLAAARKWRTRHRRATRHVDVTFLRR